MSMVSTKLHTSSTFHAFISSILIWHFCDGWLLTACSLPLLVVLLLLDVLKPDADSWLFVVVTLGDVACCCWRVAVSVDVGDNFIRLASGGVPDELRSSGVIPVGLSAVDGLLYGLWVFVVGGAGGDRFDSWWSAWRFVSAGKGLKLLKFPKFGICVDVVGKFCKVGSFRVFSVSLMSFCSSASCAARAYI